MIAQLGRRNRCNVSSLQRWWRCRFELRSLEVGQLEIPPDALLNEPIHVVSDPLYVAPRIAAPSARGVASCTIWRMESPSALPFVVRACYDNNGSCPIVALTMSGETELSLSWPHPRYLPSFLGLSIAIALRMSDYAFSVPFSGPAVFTSSK